MTTTMFLHRLGTSLAIVALLGLTGSIAWSQNANEEEAVDEAADPPVAAGYKTGSGSNNPNQGAMKAPVGGTYRSEALGGEFQGQLMVITIGGNQNGTSYKFWGARAVSLDQNSPLRKLSAYLRNGPREDFEVGDVISRLDGYTLDRGKFKDRNGVWQMPEMEDHFGATEVRWIKHKHKHVNVGEIMIDSFDPNSGNGGGGSTPVTP